MSGQRNAIGRRRLRIFLASLGFVACLFTMALVVAFYGPPYNQMWWWIMAVMPLVAAALATLLAPAIEWVMAGYRQGDGA